MTAQEKDFLEFSDMSKDYDLSIDELPDEEEQYDNVVERLSKASNKKIWLPIPIKTSEGDPVKVLIKEIGEATNEEFFSWLVYTYPTMEEYKDELNLMTKREERVSLFETVVYAYDQLKRVMGKYGLSKVLKEV